MANICGTTMYVLGEDSDICRLFDALEGMSKEYMYVEAKDMYDFMKTPEEERDDYRVAIVYIDRERNIIELESAWSCPKSFIEKLEEYFDVTSKWYSEEEGSIYFITNDSEFKYRGKYFLRIYNEVEYYGSEEEILKIVNGCIEDGFDIPEAKSVDDIIKNNVYKDNEIYLYEYTVQN